MPRALLSVSDKTGIADLGRGLAARGFELEGVWYVLVHYRDLRSAQPELDQWEDRAFVFERDGTLFRQVNL